MVADSLGYRLVDEEILQQAAESSGVSVEELADVERRTKVIDGLLRNLAVAGGAAAVMTPGGAGGAGYAAGATRPGGRRRRGSGRRRAARTSRSRP